jgi:O-antigen/teichoic acid export membrane protein
MTAMPGPTAVRSRAMQILTNAVSGAGRRVAAMVIGFGLTPFIVHALGLQQFGLWAVIGSLAGYLGLLDFGLGGAFVKFITEYVEQNRRDRARQVISFGMLFYAGFGLLLAVPVWIFSPSIVHLFKMPASELGAAVVLFHWLFALLIANMVLGLPGTAVVAMQRMDLASRNNFTGYLAYAVTTVLFVRLGWGIWGVVGAQAVQTVVSSALQYVTARKLFGPIWHNPARFERAILGRMFSFGAWTQLNSLLTIVSLDVGRFISAGIVSVLSVSYYELGSKIGFFSRSMPAYLLDAIMPAAAAADARGDEAGLERMYRRGTLYNMFATLAIGGCLIGVADPLMRVWMGQHYPYVPAIILWLTIGYVAAGLTGVGATILRAQGTPRYETYLTGVSAAVNLLSTVLLAPRLGIVGVAMGTAIGWVAGTVYFTITYHRLRPSPWWPTIGSPVARLTFAALVATVLLHFAVSAPLVTGVFGNRILGLLVIAVAGTLYLALFSGLAWVCGAFRFERDDLARRVTVIGGKLSARLGRQAA